MILKNMLSKRSQTLEEGKSKFWDLAKFLDR